MFAPDLPMPPEDRIRARPQGDLAFCLDPDAHAPAEARRRLSTGLPGGLPHSLVEDLMLLTTELVTNSVRHAPTIPAGTIDVSVAYRASAIRVEVADDGAGFAHVPQLPARLSEGGRGLFLVEAIADRWGMGDAENTTVWYELDIDRDDSAAPPAGKQVKGAGLGASASMKGVRASTRGKHVVSHAELTSEAVEIAADLRALGSSTESLGERSRTMDADLERVADTLKAGAERLRAREKVHPQPDDEPG